MASYFITGANRGIGLELTRQLSELPESKVSKIFAAIRSSPPDALQILVDSSNGRIVPVQVQITDRSSVDQAAQTVSQKLNGKGLDVLINNAGLSHYIPGPIESMSEATLREAFDVNVVAVHSVIAAFLPLLRKGQQKKIVTISSTVGAISKAQYLMRLPTPSYKASKAAVNMLTVNYALQLKDEGFTVFPLSPGWLKTDLGTENADLDVEVGVKATLDIILNAGPECNGRFRDIKVEGSEKTQPGRIQAYLPCLLAASKLASDGTFNKELSQKYKGYLVCLQWETAMQPALTLSTTAPQSLFHQQPLMPAFTEAEMAQSNTDISLHALYEAFDDINRLLDTVYPRSYFNTFRNFMLYNIVAFTPVNTLPFDGSMAEIHKYAGIVADAIIRYHADKLWPKRKEERKGDLTRALQTYVLHLLQCDISCDVSGTGVLRRLFAVNESMMVRRSRETKDNRSPSPPLEKITKGMSALLTPEDFLEDVNEENFESEKEGPTDTEPPKTDRPASELGERHEQTETDEAVSETAKE